MRYTGPCPDAEARTQSMIRLRKGRATSPDISSAAAAAISQVNDFPQMSPLLRYRCCAYFFSSFLAGPSVSKLLLLRVRYSGVKIRSWMWRFLEIFRQVWDARFGTVGAGMEFVACVCCGRRVYAVRRTEHENSTFFFFFCQAHIGGGLSCAASPA